MPNLKTFVVSGFPRILNILMDASSNLVKNLLDIFALLCAALYKGDLILLSKLLAFRKRDLSLEIFNI